MVKALYFSQHGGFDNLRYGELPEPVVKPGYVLVRVRAAALNRLDIWVLNGLPGLQLPLPHVGGSDIAGVVFGSESSEFPAGTRVVVCPGFAEAADKWTSRLEASVSPSYRIIGEHLWGGFAELVSVPTSCLVKIPDGISDSEAAAPLLVGITSWRMLVKRAQVQRGETVVIVGAGGGVNSFSIGLAKELGARVIVVTRNPGKSSMARALGADEIVDMSATPEWSKEVRNLTNKIGAEVIVDNVGTATLPESLKAAARGGRIVSVGNTTGVDVTFNHRLVFGKQLSLLGSTMGDFADFQAMLPLVWSRKIKPIVDSEFSLAEGRAAYEKLHAGNQFGKIILKPQ